MEIDAQFRDVTLRTGTGDVVTVHGARGELDGGTLSISDERHGRSAGPIDVTVPAWARVEVSTINGNLTFTGTPDRLHAETVNGFIHLTGGSGSVELESVAGEVIVTDFHGRKLSVDATGGPVSVANASGDLQLEIVNSGIEHARHPLDERLGVYRERRSRLPEGTLVAAGNYEFSSQNDDVILTLAADVSARLKITTMNGQLRSPQIPATTTGTDNASNQDRSKGRGKSKDKDEGERTFTATYGTGAARVTIDVFNGDVVVKKKP